MKMRRIISLVLAVLLMTAITEVPASALPGGQDEPVGQESGGGSAVETGLQSDAVFDIPEEDGGPDAEAGDAESGDDDEDADSEIVEAKPEGQGDKAQFIHTVSPVPLRTSGHSAYMSGYGGSLFMPEAVLTRAQTAQLLFNLLDGKCEITADFNDVNSEVWYGQAVGTLASLGVILGADGYFRPGDAVTRAEFLTMLSRFYELPETVTVDLAFSDVEEGHWAYLYILNGVSNGWVSGYSDGSFAPDKAISRAEAAVIVNRVLGFSPDRRTIDADLNMNSFVDILPSHWAFYDIMEATIDHVERIQSNGERWVSYDKTGLELSEGFHFLGGYLYYYDASLGGLARNGAVGTFTFDENGRYTTGNSEIDMYLHNITVEAISPSMSREEMLRAVYLYTRDGFTYLRRNYYSSGATGWEMQEALIMLQTRYGNCYCYAAVFYYLSRWVGYDSLIYAGTVGSGRDPHGWVEIMFDDVIYIFDVELEMARLRDGRPYNDLYKFTYEQAPWGYYK